MATTVTFLKYQFKLCKVSDCFVQRRGAIGIRSNNFGAAVRVTQRWSIERQSTIAVDRPTHNTELFNSRVTA